MRKKIGMERRSLLTAEQKKTIFFSSFIFVMALLMRLLTMTNEFLHSWIFLSLSPSPSRTHFFPFFCFFFLWLFCMVALCVERQNSKTDCIHIFNRSLQMRFEVSLLSFNSFFICRSPLLFILWQFNGSSSLWFLFGVHVRSFYLFFYTSKTFSCNETYNRHQVKQKKSAPTTRTAAKHIHPKNRRHFCCRPTKQRDELICNKEQTTEERCHCMCVCGRMSARPRSRTYTTDEVIVARNNEDTRRSWII